MIMPSGCKDAIDLIHMDKGKIVGMGNYGTGPFSLKREDMACIVAKTADHIHSNISVNVKNTGGSIDYFAVDHHGWPMQLLPGSADRWLRMPFIALTLPGQKGIRFDLGFSKNARCSFDKTTDEPYELYDIRRGENIVGTPATRQIINCKGDGAGEEVFHTKDQVNEKKRAVGMEDSILSDFLDASKFTNGRSIDLPSGGTMVFTPFYFTEQWFMIRSGGQLKEKTEFPLFDEQDRKRKRKGGSGIISKVERLDREVDFLFGSGEKTILLDIQAEDGKVAGSTIGKDPNTYPINKAYIDPKVIDSVTFDSPREFKAKSVSVVLKPGTKCELRSNFKRRPSTTRDEILFCTDLSGIEDNFKDRAGKIQLEFRDQIAEEKQAKKEYKGRSKEEIKRLKKEIKKGEKSGNEQV